MAVLRKLADIRHMRGLMEREAFAWRLVLEVEVELFSIPDGETNESCR